MKTQFKVSDKTMRLSSNDNQFTLCELVEVTNKESKSFGEVQERNHRYFPKLDQVVRRLIHIGVDNFGELDLQDFPEMMDSLVEQICNSIEAGK
jgi:predicted transcriptional regulator